MTRFVLRGLLRNPWRTAATLSGVTLAVAFITAISVYISGSSGQLTARAVAPVTVDMQATLTNPLASRLGLKEAANPAGPLAAGDSAVITLMVTNTDTVPATAVLIQD